MDAGRHTLLLFSDLAVRTSIQVARLRSLRANQVEHLNQGPAMHVDGLLCANEAGYNVGCKGRVREKHPMGSYKRNKLCSIIQIKRRELLSRWTRNGRCRQASYTLISQCLVSNWPSVLSHAQIETCIISRLIDTHKTERKRNEGVLIWNNHEYTPKTKAKMTTLSFRLRWLANNRLMLPFRLSFQF